MEASRSRLNVSIWGELTPLSARAHTRPHSLPNSAEWIWALCRNRVWHRANSLRQRSTYGPLSPLRCSARSWYKTESSGTSSALGTMDGYLPRSTAVICNLWGGKIRSSVLASLKKMFHLCCVKILMMKCQELLEENMRRCTTALQRRTEIQLDAAWQEGKRTTVVLIGIEGGEQGWWSMWR